MPRGGKRPGAGRKPTELSRIAIPLKKLTAEEILASVNELEQWQELLEAMTYLPSGIKGEPPIQIPDLRVRADALKYLTNRRDGMPTQAVVQKQPDHDLGFGDLPGTQSTEANKPN